MLRSIGKQSGESVESVPMKKKKDMAEKEGFKPGMNEGVMDDENRWNRWKKCHS